MDNFNPIRIGNADASGYMLPVEFCYTSGADEPILVKWWQWIPPQTGCSVGYWALIIKGEN